MTESKESEASWEYKDIEQEILRFLESRGSIKAALLHKIENYFCGQKSKINISKDLLISCLLSMAKEKIIEIIIPELFRIKWNQKRLKNLRYLEDEIYLCRTFSQIKSKYLYKTNPNDYYFDSRKISFNDKELLNKWINHLEIILEKVRNLNKKIIIFNPIKSNPIGIYEKKFQVNYKLKNPDYQIKQDNLIKEKINFSLVNQAEVLAIVQGYRNRYMCFYIPLIESILKTIEYIQYCRKKIRDYNNILQKYILKFAYHCIEFVKSDYIEIKPNSLRWESFFNYFQLPIKVLTYDFKSIQFHGRTFDNYQELKICIYIEKKFLKMINQLRVLGYKEFPEEIYEDNYITIGLDVEIYYPCSTIEHIYFLSKYICFYCLFLLFSHSFGYFIKAMPEKKFINKEKTLYQNFLPVINQLFDVKGTNLPKKFVFKYYTYNPDELEVIFNHFLIPAVAKIEKKMYKYFRFRSSLR
ncbi:MAG: hypothetical protein ACFFHV_07330 [Promethearchaeota archaeon]